MYWFKCFHCIETDNCIIESIIIFFGSDQQKVSYW